MSKRVLLRCGATVTFEHGVKAVETWTVCYLLKILGPWCEVAMLDGHDGRVARADVDFQPGARLLALHADDAWFDPGPEPVTTFKPGERVVVPRGSSPVDCFGDDGHPRRLLAELRGVVAAAQTPLDGLELVVRDDGHKFYIPVDALENELAFDVLQS